MRAMVRHFFVAMILCSILSGIIMAEEINLIDANSFIDNLKEKIKKNPSDIENIIELGNIYFQVQDYESASRYYQEAINVDKANAIAHYNFGKTMIVLGDKDAGIGQCEVALKLGLDDINVYRTLAVEYFNKRELQKALDMYKNIQRLEPTDDMAYYASGVIYFGLGEGWKARKEFEKAVEINPNNAEAHYELGWLYRDYDAQKSQMHYETVLKLTPNHEKARQELVELKKKVGVR